MKLPINYEEAHWAVRKEAREQYIEEQDGRCQHCGISLKASPDTTIPINKDLFPKGFFNYPIHLHHCHKTGMSIGAIHAYCNAYLWEHRGV